MLVISRNLTQPSAFLLKIPGFAQPVRIWVKHKPGHQNQVYVVIDAHPDIRIEREEAGLASGGSHGGVPCTPSPTTATSGSIPRSTAPGPAQSD